MSIESASETDSTPVERMQRRRRRGFRIATILIGAGVLLHLFGFLLVPFPPPAVDTVELPPKPVQWLSSEGRDAQWLREILEIQDPRHLFYASRPVRTDRTMTPDRASAPTDLRVMEAFAPFNPPLDLREALSPESWMLQARSGAEQGKPSEWDLRLLTESFGQRETWRPLQLHAPLSARIRDASGGWFEIEIQLAEEGLLPPEGLWEPMRFRLQVSPGDLIPPPLLIRGSGDDSFDQAVAETLTRLPEIRQLPAGFYELRLSP